MHLVLLDCASEPAPRTALSSPSVVTTCQQAHWGVRRHPTADHLARRLETPLTDLALDPGTPPASEAVAARSPLAEEQTDPVLLRETTPTEAVPAAHPSNPSHVTLDPLEQPLEGQVDRLTRSRRDNAAGLPRAM